MKSEQARRDWRGFGRFWGCFVFVVGSLAVGAAFQDGGSHLPATGNHQKGDEPRIAHFEQMRYPLSARIRAVEGVVVLKGSVSSKGSVEQVSVLSGPPLLTEDAASNLRKWLFQSPLAGDVIVVYWFRISGLCEAPCPSSVEFHPPNLMVITTGRELAMP